MKKMPVILCLMIFAYIQVGYFIHSLALRAAARQEFKHAVFASLPDNDLDIIALQDVETKGKWEDEGEEFWLNGKLYDVVRQEQVNGKTYLYCLSDTKEEMVVNDQLKLTSNNTNSNGKHSKTIKFSIPDFVVVRNEVAAITSILVASFDKDCYQRELVQNFEPISPPPQG